MMRYGRFVLIIILAAAVTVTVTPGADASLASIGTSIIRWMSLVDIVGHEIEAVVDVNQRVAEFTDEVTIRSRGGRSLITLLGDDFRLDSVTDVASGQALSFGPYLNLGGLPFTIYKVDIPSMRSGEEARLRFQWTVSDETIEYIDPFAAPGYFYVGHMSLWHPHTPDEGFFTANIEVAAHRHLTVIADGLATSSTVEGDWSSHRFESVAAVNGIGIAVGAFDALQPIQLGDMTVRAYAPKGWKTDIESVHRYAAHARRFLSDMFFPLEVKDWHVIRFPFDYPASYTSVHGFVYGGDLSLVGAYDEPSLANLVAHEIAHQWIGNAVGVRVVGSAWLGEGIAEYFGYLATENLVSPMEYSRVFKERNVDPYLDILGTRASKPLGKIEFLDEEWQQIGQKGALLFRDIHNYMGDEHFIAMIQQFLVGHRGKIVSGNDFIKFGRDYVRGLPQGGAANEMDARHVENIMRQWLRNDPEIVD